jgi:Fe-S-cluster containining protein
VKQTGGTGAACLQVAVVARLQEYRTAKEKYATWPADSAGDKSRRSDEETIARSFARSGQPVKRNKKKPRGARQTPTGARAEVRRDAAGRVHLVLERDPAGNEFFALSAPLFEESWQNDVTAGTANTAFGVLSDQPNLERTVELARSVMAATSRMAEGLLARAPRGAVACKAGCDHCCYQAVGVTPPEALAIVEHVKRTRSADELAALRERVFAFRERTSGLSSAERFSAEFPCVFLESGRCSIYEVRPLSCRGMNSLDAGECQSRLRDPQARDAFLTLGSGGHSYMEPIRAFHAVSAGLQLALAELYRLDARPLDLAGAMHLLLSAPETLGEAWLTGRSPFDSALSGEQASDPGMRELSGALSPSKSNE